MPDEETGEFKLDKKVLSLHYTTIKNDAISFKQLIFFFSKQKMCYLVTELRIGTYLEKWGNIHIYIVMYLLHTYTYYI